MKKSVKTTLKTLANHAANCIATWFTPARAMSVFLAIVMALSGLAGLSVPAAASSKVTVNNISLTPITSLEDVESVPQTTGYTCSAASALTVLRSLGECMKVSDQTLYAKIDGYVYKIVNVLNSYEATDGYQYQTVNSADKLGKIIEESLQARNPVIVRIKITDKTYFPYTSNGHYTPVVGLYKDSNGKKWVKVADSYANRFANTKYSDKSTGFVYLPLEKLFEYGKAKGSAYAIYSTVARDVRRFNKTKVSLAANTVVRIKTACTEVQSPFCEGKVLRKYSVGQTVIVESKGQNLISGHYWYKVKNGGFIYVPYTVAVSVKSPSVSSVTSSLTKIKVKYGSVSNMSGYQVQFLLNGTVKATVTTSGLSASFSGSLLKKYTVRVRSYVDTVQGRVYSSWSAAKTVTCY